MNQIEIDGLIESWLNARDRAEDLRRQASRAETDVSNETIRLAKSLLPEGAKPLEKYIYSTTDGKMIVAFLKSMNVHKVERRIEGSGGATSTIFEPTVEEHKPKK